MSANTDIIKRQSFRLETCAIIAKAIAYVSIGVFTPWSAALAQWINSGEWPPRIVWIAVILPASVVGGATQLLAFLSGSYQTYLKVKNNTNPTHENETPTVQS